MKYSNASENRTASRILVLSAAPALAAALAVSAAHSAPTGEIVPPPVPDAVRVPEGNVPFFMGHATGTQNYMCLPVELNKYDWVLVTPQATLFNDNDKPVATHFFSLNPLEDETVRPEWLHGRDASRVWGEVFGKSSDAEFVEPDAVPWLLLWVKGAAAGPNGGDTFTATTFIQRVKTTGGLKPTTDCYGLDNVGDMRFVPYTADYYFYKSIESEEGIVE